MVQRAVVIGGSMGGLCAAAGLARTAQSVYVVERDGGATAGEPRKGVPQGAHAHLLLERGRLALEGLFEGITDDLQEAGAQRFNLGRQFRWRFHGRWMVPHDSDLATYFMSRPLLENVVRHRVAALPNVEVLAGASVEAPSWAEGSRVTGVTLRGGEVLPADLVVDASGRGSKTPAWLADVGVARVPADEIGIDLNYTSGVFELPAMTTREPTVVYHAPPHQPRAGALFPIEGGRWLVGAVGYHGERAPTDLEGFIAWTSTLDAPDVHRGLQGARTIRPLVHMKVPKQVRRRYERVPMPAGFVVLGDALCAFDPVFGQGMSVAAMEAERLASDVARPGFDARRTMKRIGKIVDVPWSMSMGEAFRWPQVTGRGPVGGGMLRAYLSAVYLASSRDPVVYDALLRVLNLVAPPTRLLRPGLGVRVLRARVAG